MTRNGERIYAPTWHCYRHGMRRSLCACAAPETKCEQVWVDLTWQDYSSLPLEAGHEQPSPSHEAVWRCTVFAPGRVALLAGWHPVEHHAVHDAILLWNRLDIAPARCTCRARATVRLTDRDAFVCLVCGRLQEARDLAACRA